MSDMLSQAEIDALLNGTAGESILKDDPFGIEEDVVLTNEEKDALGEIGNISMGTSATTLSMLLNNKVTITTPVVSVKTWDQLVEEYKTPYVAVTVEYKEGLIGTNLMIISENDVKIITDLMMGGDGSNTAQELNDLHLSAISEAMNQMIGSASTSMSSIFNKKIDIHPPKAFVMHFDSFDPREIFTSDGHIVKIAFKMVVGDVIDSEIMQLLPVDFAKALVRNLLNMESDNNMNTEYANETKVPQASSNMNSPSHSGAGYKEQQTIFSHQESYEKSSNDSRTSRMKESYNVHPAQFQAFEDEKVTIEKKNINLIMDVPLEVTVELGRTQKLIKEILEFSSGSIIELDKLAGEPVDILVNGKLIAKGEVVVIDESFGVRVTDIVHPSKRL